MGLGNLGRFLSNFARDVDDMTKGFDKVFGPAPESFVNTENAGRRAELSSPRRKRNILDNEPVNKPNLALRKRREDFY